METMDVYCLDTNGYAQRIFGALCARWREYSFGIFEDDLLKETGLDKEIVLQHLEEMVRLEFVTSKISQKGTGGPHGHWYMLAAGVQIKVLKKKEQIRAPLAST